MTVQASQAFSGPYTANGSTVAFPFTFPCQQAADVAIVNSGVAVTTGFTIALNSNQTNNPGGTVTFTTAPASGTIVIYSNPDFGQNVAHSTVTPWSANTVASQNKANDRAAIRDQALARDMTRAMLAQVGETPALLPSKTSRIGKVLAFDANGDPVAASYSGSDGSLRADLSAAAPASPGAALVTYVPKLATTYIPRGVGDKLDENRSVLDFIPSAQKANILAGTSTWDASAAINAGIIDVGGQHIDMTAARQIAIGSPIVLQRGTALRSKNGFDETAGRSSRIFLLNGANCAAIQTRSAADGSAAGTYYDLQGLVIDGNGANQTASTPGGIVQWYGVFMGSSIRHCFILNSKGPGIVVGNGPNSPLGSWGADTLIEYLWVLGSILASGQYAFDTNLGLYSTNSNGDYSGNVSGLMMLNHLFVENPVATYGDVPRTTIGQRLRDCVRLHNVEKALVGAIHVEAAVHGIRVDGCRDVVIQAPSGAWITDGSTADAALISIGPGNQALSIGPTTTYGGVPGAISPIAPIKKASDLTVNPQYWPDMPVNLSNKTGSGSYAARDYGVTPAYLGHNPQVSNLLSVSPVSGYSAPEVRVVNALGTVDPATYGYLKAESDGFLKIGTTYLQSGAEYNMITLATSATSSNNYIKVSDPIALQIRSVNTNIVAGGICWVGTTNANAVLFAKTPDSFAMEIPLMRRGSGSPYGVLAPRVEGELYWDYTNKRQYVSTGTANGNWSIIGPHATKGVTASRPSLGVADMGYLYFDTTLNANGKPIWWTGAAWVDSTGAAV